MKLNNDKWKNYLHYYLVKFKFTSSNFTRNSYCYRSTSFIQSTNRVVLEAGLDDTTVGFESAYDAGFILNPIFIPLINRLSRQCVSVQCLCQYCQCSRQCNPWSKTTMNSGQRVPASTYDFFINKAIRPQNLTPANGGNYITVPNNASRYKIMEFVTCKIFQFNLDQTKFIMPCRNLHIEINYNCKLNIINSVLRQ
jgi:hypothetical protein